MGFGEKTIERERQKTIRTEVQKQQQFQREIFFNREMTENQKTVAPALGGGPPLPVMEAPARKWRKHFSKSKEREQTGQDEKQQVQERQQEQGVFVGGIRRRHQTSQKSSEMEEKKIGALKEEERTRTYSDVQRMAFKGNLLDCVREDEKTAQDKEFKKILEQIKEYANIDATGDMALCNKREILNKEQELLVNIMKKLETRIAALSRKGSMEAGKELENLCLYKKYFDLDVSGYLQVPDEAELGSRFHDCRKAKLTNKYKPLPMKEIPKEQPLFPHEPSVNDIAQGGLGDCYLLAALAAVVDRNPQWIKDCMKDHGDGTVTVRLYDKDERGELLPHYIKISKKVPKSYERVKEPFAKGSLWVQLIEHAYTVSGMHVNGGRSNNKDDYGNIAGGNPEQMVERILGRKVENHIKGRSSKKEIKSVSDLQKYMRKTFLKSLNKDDKGKLNEEEENSIVNSIVMNMTEATEEEKKLLNFAVADYYYLMGKAVRSIKTMEDFQKFFDITYERYQEMELEQLQNTYSKTREEMPKRREKCIQDKKDKETIEAEIAKITTEEMTKEMDEEDRKQLENKIKKLQSKVNGLESSIKAFQVSEQNITKMERLEKRKKNNWQEENEEDTLDTVGQSLKLEKEYYNTVKAFYKQHSDAFFRNKPFSGKYGSRALKRYTKIDQAVREGKYLTGYTLRKEIDKSKDGWRKETVKNGVAYRHAYTVMGVKEIGDHKYVKIRNPWGDTIRAYSQVGEEILQKEEKGENHGIFLLELNEFMKCFEGIGVVG